ncbi:MAG: hypothetical protein RJB38_1729 [Pseudomonadota bacterium]
MGVELGHDVSKASRRGHFLTDSEKFGHAVSEASQFSHESAHGKVSDSLHGGEDQSWFSKLNHAGFAIITKKWWTWVE